MASVASSSQENDALNRLHSLPNHNSAKSMGSGDGPNSSFLFGAYGVVKHQDSQASGDKQLSMDKTTEPSGRIGKSYLEKRLSKERESGGSKFSVLQKWLRGDDKKGDGEKKSSPGRLVWKDINNCKWRIEY